jgi:non-ribosomal peptide synthetase component F
LVDPSHPSQRLQSIIKRSDACLALTDEAQSDRLSQWTRTMTTSKVLNPSSASRGTLVPRLRGPAHDACIVFTSGSTVEPKAICWSHETVAVTALEIGARFHLSPRSRVFQFSSYAFDVSIHETMATLVRGGCICAVPTGCAGTDDRILQRFHHYLNPVRGAGAELPAYAMSRGGSILW